MTSGPLPRRVVALGGGTGLPAVLRGLKGLVRSGHVSNLTAVVTMSDDGGSSGRLRRSRHIPPPGDLRNCLVALAAEEDLLAGLFQHRYAEGDAELGGHTLGNLILAALAEQTGDFLTAVERSSRVLRTAGRILPVTLEHVTLEAELENGTWLRGESAIGRCRDGIRRVALRPRKVAVTPGIVEAIRQADLVVLGPGSLFTSVAPNLVVGDVARALRETTAIRVMVANLVGEAGEANGLGLADHLRVVHEHAEGEIVDALVVNDGPIDDATLERYREEGTAPLTLPEGGLPGVHVVEANLLAAGPKLRHEPRATAAALVQAWRALTGRGAGGTNRGDGSGLGRATTTAGRTATGRSAARRRGLTHTG